jgi:predicted small metal-binding protein
MGFFMKSFACKDIGMQCDFVTKARTEEALMKKIAEHVKKAHNMQNIDEAMLSKIKSAIKEV